MSKGSRNRVDNIEKYTENYKKIFGKTPPKDLSIERAEQLDIILDDEQKLSRQRTEKKIIVKKEYTDRNGVDMVVVNINDSMTNTIMTARELKALRHENINDEYVSVEDDVIDVSSE